MELIVEIKDMKIRLPSNIKDKLIERANQNDRTINGEVLQILKVAMGVKSKEAA